MPDTLDQLRRNLDRFDAVTEARLRSVAFRTSRAIRQRAGEILNAITHGTGLTARSIVVDEVPEEQMFLVIAQHPVKPNLPLWLERGTVHMRARPFMRPAGDELWPAYEAEMIAVATHTAEELLS